MSNTLFCGPFVGEFGMELFTYQSHIRKMSEAFDKTIISSRPEHEFLYKDFCDEFIPFNPQSYNCSGFECSDYKNVPNIHETYNATKVLRILNLDSYLAHIRGTEEKFVSYRQKNIDNVYNIDICVCARSFKHGAFTKIERNWDINECRKTVGVLLDYGFKVASVGLSASAEYIYGTENYMDISLEKLANLFSCSKMIIGPSSGIMHFATLCECPQVVWGEDHLQPRYEELWNPFNTKVNYIVNNHYDLNHKAVIENIIV